MGTWSQKNLILQMLPSWQNYNGKPKMIIMKLGFNFLNRNIKIPKTTRHPLLFIKVLEKINKFSQTTFLILLEMDKV